MSVIEQKSYGIQCDYCDIVYESPFTGFSLWLFKESAIEDAQEHDWIFGNEKCACPNCRTQEIDEEVINEYN